MAEIPLANRLPAMLRDTVVGLVRRDGADLSARQLTVLLICCLEDGPHTVRGMAARMNVVAKPAITRALDRLEEFGMTQRKTDPSDRRSVLITRTSGGTAYLAHVRALLHGAAKTYGVNARP